MIAEKCIGSRPVSDKTAKFEEYLFTPLVHFKKLTCDLSAKLFLYIGGNKKVSSFLQAFELVLKTPQILDPYNKIGLIKWSYKCKLVLTLGSVQVISFVTLNVAFLALLKISFWP